MGQQRMVHVGSMIKEVFDRHPKAHNIVWLAEQLHCQRANVYKIFRRATIDTQLLMTVSAALDHDFFADLSAALRASESKSETK